MRFNPQVDDAVSTLGWQGWLGLIIRYGNILTGEGKVSYGWSKNSEDEQLTRRWYALTNSRRELQLAQTSVYASRYVCFLAQFFQ